MVKPLFSIIIPTLNEEQFLPNLLDSLVSQSKDVFEVLVVDGKSKDKTVDIAKSFKKTLPDIHVVVAEKASLPYQRNLGAKKAKGDWYVFIDADSVLLPYFIERCEQFIEQYKPEVFTTWFRSDSELANDALTTVMFLMMLEGSMLLKRPNIAPGPLTVIKKEVFLNVGGYDEAHAFHEDLDLGLRLLKKNVRGAFLRETLYKISLRRFRNEGTLKVLQKHGRSVLSILLLGRAMKEHRGYIMGGHLYKEGKKKESLFEEYERKFTVLIKKLFE